MRRDLQGRVEEALESVRRGVSRIDSTARRLEADKITKKTRDGEVTVTVSATGVVQRIHIDPVAWEQHSSKEVDALVTGCVVDALKLADLKVRQEQAKAGARFTDLERGGVDSQRPVRRTGVLGGERVRAADAD